MTMQYPPTMTKAGNTAVAHQRQQARLRREFDQQMTQYGYEPVCDQYDTVMLWRHTSGYIVENGRAWEYWLMTRQTPVIHYQQKGANNE